jgi:hypothetical protein
MSELLRVYLALKIVLKLYRFPMRLNISETAFTYGLCVSVHSEPIAFPVNVAEVTVQSP